MSWVRPPHWPCFSSFEDARIRLNYIFKKILVPPGLEPGTFRVLSERDNHYTMELVARQSSFLYNFPLSYMNSRIWKSLKISQFPRMIQELVYTYWKIWQRFDEVETLPIWPSEPSRRKVQIPNQFITGCLRPYHDEHTRSRLITEVKHRRARILLGWGTAWEHLVP